MTKEDDRRRDRSFHAATPGHWWSLDPQPTVTHETDVSHLNLENVHDFLTFLQALNRGETKAQNFFAQMPAWRVKELREKYSHLEPQMIAFNK